MHTDFLVIGSGVAGTTFSIDVSCIGKVAIITKKWSTETNTNYAQGGVSAAIGKNDSPELHVNDTLIAGDGLCKENAVRLMTEKAKDAIEGLENLGVEFSRDTNGNLALGMEGGHSVRRILHTVDATGAEIERALVKELNVKNINLFEDLLALDLILKDGKCVGVWVLDIKKGKIFPFLASIVFIATGGAGCIFERTTNPPIATGDGIAMAYRAGAAISNMEFIQFHPTAFYGKHKDGRLLLLSEAIRGEGAVLKNIHNVKFMDKYDSRKELAPRDIVARAIYHELKNTDTNYVLLDATNFPKGHFLKRFPNIYHACREFGIDPINEPIPVAPAAHYLCGGIYVDTYGQTEIPYLYAGGEVSCTGAHGANRLASNSLLEALVFSHRAGEKAMEDLQQTTCEQLDKKLLSEAIRDNYPVFMEKKIYPISEWTQQVKKTMWKKVGIVRTTEELKSAQTEISHYKKEVDEIYEKCFPTLQLVEFRNILTVAELVIISALQRKETRGLHCNVDYPYKDDINYKKDTTIKRLNHPGN